MIGVRIQCVLIILDAKLKSAFYNMKKIHGKNIAWYIFITRPVARGGGCILIHNVLIIAIKMSFSG